MLVCVLQTGLDGVFNALILTGEQKQPHMLYINVRGQGERARRAQP